MESQSLVTQILVQTNQTHVICLNILNVLYNIHYTYIKIFKDTKNKNSVSK